MAKQPGYLKVEMPSKYLSRCFCVPRFTTEPPHKLSPPHSQRKHSSIGSNRKKNKQKKIQARKAGFLWVRHHNPLTTYNSQEDGRIRKTDCQEQKCVRKGSRNRIATKTNPGGKKSSPTYRWKDMPFLKHTYFNSRKTSTTTI